MPFKERLGDRRSDLRFEIIGQLWGSLETVEHLPSATSREAARSSSRGCRSAPRRCTRPAAVRRPGERHPGEVRHVTSVRDVGRRAVPGWPGVRRPGPAALEQIDQIVAARLAEAKPIAEA